MVYSLHYTSFPFLKGCRLERAHCARSVFPFIKKKKKKNVKVDGRSARGKPRFGWMDGVKRALNDRRMDMREGSERARNRNEWRMIVTQF